MMSGAAVATTRRPGRKRMGGPRYPSGDRIIDDEQRQADDKIRASRQPHRRMLAPEDRLSEKAESPLGRLYHAGKLCNGYRPFSTEEWERALDRYQAGERYAAVVGLYRATIEGPRTTGGGGRGLDCHGLACRTTEIHCECGKRRSAYMNAYDALSATRRRAVMAVNSVVISREAIFPQQFKALRQGLDALSRHFGLVKAKH